MDPLIGTPHCPHLGYETSHGWPCCRADDATRKRCGKWAPNSVSKNRAAAPGVLDDAVYLCASLGSDALPPEALRLKRRELERENKLKKQAGSASGTPRFRPPDKVSGAKETRPSREQDFDAEGPGQPVIPTHTLRDEGRKVRPNDKCPCGSGKKFKKCCGR